MSDHHKYAKNDICFFKNAQEHMRMNYFNCELIGEIGGIGVWLMTMRQRIINDEVYYYPVIIAPVYNTKLKSRHFLNILKNNGSSGIPSEYNTFFDPLFGATGGEITADELLNEENGYLTNGGIMIEYGIQIEGIFNKNGIWTFNFYDRIFDCEEKSNMISFYKKTKYGKQFLYCHKQLLVHHSTYFNSDSKENQMIELTDEDLDQFNHFLQFSHGVRDHTYQYEYIDVLKYAQRYKLFNVIQLLDELMKFKTLNCKTYLPYAMSFNLKRYLANFFKKQKTPKELAEKLKDLDLETMSGEAMKKCVKRFLEF